MEILSNWGDARRVGLTEVEFFDLRHRKLFVSPHDVDLRHSDAPGELACLVNRSLTVSLPRRKIAEGLPSQGARGSSETAEWLGRGRQLCPGPEAPASSCSGWAKAALTLALASRNPAR